MVVRSIAIRYSLFAMVLTGAKLTCERGGRSVFRELSFSLQSGGLMQLTGPNGSGKSSLLRLIAGLNEATEGKLELDGGNADLSLGQQSHYIAHQEAVKAALSVAENLAFWGDFLATSPTVLRLNQASRDRCSSW